MRRAVVFRRDWWITAAVLIFGPMQPGWAEFQFHHRYIAEDLPLASVGLTALVDVDRDGRLDFVLGAAQPAPSTLYWFRFVARDRWEKHVVGTNFLSVVGLAALDVDGDGWLDFVCSGVWYRNTGKPRQEQFERIVFDPNAGGAHDIVAADIDGDGRKDIVMMGDERTRLNSLRWYKIPADPRQPWPFYQIGPPVHGAITPNGIMDVDSDGDLDVLRADTWFENHDSKGTKWLPHPNIPFGRKGPYGVCVRTAVADLDTDGNQEIIMVDADITDGKAVILRTPDKGQSWQKQQLPQSFSYGSMHTLAVADFNGDARPDIFVNEQEDLLPKDRQNPRWVIWENLGGGRFAERIILDQKLGGHEAVVGDVDGDGDIDICSKEWIPKPYNANQGRMHLDFLENLLASPKTNP
ncbi:MAG: VCBS repeat-containing protein [Thermoguttaceae bacterium]|nr:VCBS repeat-containing protein [Thermoguttaceae bacterium]MDW8036613.1 VCBS repeat-containing protein [Thermoguttaceae bacterium]